MFTRKLQLLLVAGIKPSIVSRNLGMLWYAPRREKLLAVSHDTNEQRRLRLRLSAMLLLAWRPSLNCLSKLFLR